MSRSGCVGRERGGRAGVNRGRDDELLWVGTRSDRERRRGGAFLREAVGAGSHELVVVRLEAESVPARELPLQDLERLEPELDDLRTASAHEMVVVVVSPGRLVALRVSCQDRGLENARLRQER